MTTTTETRPPVLNLPNQLTAARFVLSLFLFALIHFEYWSWCLLVFAVAAFTDWLDGYLARIHNSASVLGRNLDPLVDKVLLCGTFIFLLPIGGKAGWLAPWMVTLVVARELIITSLRSYLESLGAKFGADWLGKIKMVLQCGAVIMIFIALLSTENFATWTASCERIRDVLIWAMLLATLFSGLQYLWKAGALLRKERLD